MTHIIEFSIAASDVISANGREHHMTKARKTRVLREVAAVHAREYLQGQTLAGRTTPLVESAHVTLAIGWQPLKRTRDADNLSSTAKPCFDAFTDVGIWEDDDDKHRLSTTYTTYSRSEAGRVWLRFDIEDAS